MASEKSYETQISKSINKVLWTHGLAHLLMHCLQILRPEWRVAKEVI